MNVKNRLVQLLLLFIFPLLVPVTFLLFTINRYGVSVPYWDEWDMIPIFQKINQGKSPLGLLWLQANEHRMFFPKLALTGTAYLTHWHIAIEVLLSAGFILVTAVLLYLIIRRTIKRSLLAFLAMLITSFWLFSPIQSDSLLWGWCIEWFMCMAAVTATIFFISRLDVKKKLRLNLTGAIVAAIVATFSLADGLILWPIGLAILVAKKQTRKPMIIWCVAALLSILAFFYRYQHLAGDGLTSLHKPVDSVRYFIALFGRPFTDNLDASMFLGAIILLLLVPVLFLVWQKRKKLDIYLPWLALIAFSLFSSIMITAARLTPLTENATPSRYTPLMILYLVGLSGLIFTFIDGMNPSKKLVRGVVIIALAINIPLLFSSYSVGVYQSKLWSKQMRSIEYCTHQPVVSDACLQQTSFNNLKTSRANLQFLKDRHWAGY